MSSNLEEAVRKRYTESAKNAEAGLCCPSSYDSELLVAIPKEVLDRDYGCGNPMRHLQPGDAVLDLGSGAGKACFLASQLVGKSGRVIGVDMNDEMLEIARRNAPEVARRIGYGNVEFRKGKIQDLELDLERLDHWLRDHPVTSVGALVGMEETIAALRESHPLIPSESMDVVVSNCVLNLVRPEDKHRLFGEMFRVLRPGGRVVISDIVSDEDIPARIRSDPALWSGCISGAFREDHFLEAFEQADFYGISIVDRQEQPWRTLEGIEFRSMTVAAYKGKEGPCLDGNHAVVYRGPFRQVEDDDGHRIRRGERTAVCEKTFGIYSRVPYRSHFELIPPRVPVLPDEAHPFPCAAGSLRRDPKQTKGERYRPTTEARTGACGPGNDNGSCC